MAENENIGGIEAKLGLDADGFKKGIEEAKQDMKKMTDESKKFNQDFKTVSKSLRDVGVDSKEIRKIKTEMLASKPELFEKQLKNVESQLRAIGASSSQISKVKVQIQEQGTALESTSGKLSKMKVEFDENAKSASNLSKEIGTAGVAYAAYAAAVAAALAKAVDISAQFEQAMAKVKAISGATGQEFDKLRQQAIDLGATTVFSSTQAAEAQSFLAMAGFKTKEIMEAMPGVLSLAAAGQMEIARTADIASNILTGFRLSADQTTGVVDVLAKAMTSSNTNIEQLGYAMKYVAPIAASLGMSIEEAAASVGELSNAGIQGEMAGTQLRAMLLRLASPTKEAQFYMDKLKVTTKDAAGNILPFANIIGQFEQAFKKLNQSQQAQVAASIAGTEAASGFLTLISTGQSQLESFTSELENSAGAADKLAETQMDTLKGSIEEFKSAMEAAAITIGDKFAPTVRSITDTIATLILSFNDLDAGTQNAIITFVAVTAAVTGITLAVYALRTALIALQASFPPLLAISAIIGGAAAAFAYFKGQSDDATASAEKFAQAQEEVNQALGKSPLNRTVQDVQDLQERTEQLNSVLEERAALQDRLNEIEALQADHMGTPQLLSEMMDINDELVEMDEKLRGMGYDGVEQAQIKLEQMNDAIEESVPALLKMREAEITDLAAKNQKVEAMAKLSARYKELASAQNLDASQKQELINVTDQLRKQYPDLNALQDESGRITIKNIGIIDDHISAERNFIDMSAKAANAYLTHLEAMAKANKASVEAQIKNFEALAKAMSAVSGSANPMMAKNVTAVGGVSVNKTFENFANGGVDKQLTALYDKQNIATQNLLEVQRAKDSLTSGEAFKPVSGGGIDLSKPEKEKKTKAAKDKKEKSGKSAAELAAEARKKAYDADIATVRYQADMYDWSAEEQIKAYNKVAAKHKQHLKETVEDQRTMNLQIKRLQEDSVKARYDFSSEWIDKDQRRMEESGKSEVQMATAKLNAWTRVRDRYKKDSEEYKKADEQVYQSKKELTRQLETEQKKQYQTYSENITKEERRMEELGKSELEIGQMKLKMWTELRDRYKKDSDLYKQADEQVYQAKKSLLQQTQKDTETLLKKQKTAVNDAKKAELAAIDARKKAFVDAQNEKIKAIDDLIKKEQEANEDVDYETELAKKRARVDLLSTAVSPEGIKERNDLIAEIERMQLEHSRELRKRDLEDQKDKLQDEKSEQEQAFEDEKTATEARYDALAQAFEDYGDNVKLIESAVQDFRVGANQEANKQILSDLDTFLSQYQSKMKTASSLSGTSQQALDLQEYNANKDAYNAAKAAGNKDEMQRLSQRNQAIRDQYGIDKDTGKISSFDVGGVVPGPPGAPMEAVVHGEEAIFNRHQLNNLFRLLEVPKLALKPEQAQVPATQVTNHIDLSTDTVVLEDKADMDMYNNGKERLARSLQRLGMKG
ncbi:phage tail tape measure protein [Paenibacillus sp. LK1]|uniref:phage tail tape measure protein n=1 Tax=Paenibacillus sp. LK1 TaxID=2053014 RepID=UPI000C1A06E1|nr:phage tail tape measure protein [Paenibacillus sp. LK1]PIH58287.1 phage tail tape measure protein [Paenibacillus sp. LK1]